ncbi:MAG: hypothetical protein Q8P52_02055 [bacterium]|nr:hypothetical protein [bacterium]
MEKIPYTGRPEDDSIEKMKTRLYSREKKYASGGLRRADLHSENPQVPSEWKKEEAEGYSKLPNYKNVIPKESMTSGKRIFLVALGFFALSLGVAAFMFLGGGNKISVQNVNISVLGPVSIAGGEELSFEVSVENQNNAPLQSAEILVEYPDSARNPENLSENLRRHRESLGEIAAGESVVKKMNVVLFGEEGQTQEVLVTVEYRVPGSDPIFSKKKKYEVVVSSSPVRVVVEALKEVSAGQEVELSITVSSNSPTTLKNILFKAEYPFGFVFTKSFPQAISGNNLWNLADLEPQGKKTVKIYGKIEGQDREERVFRFETGAAKTQDPKAIATTLLETQYSLTIEKPFLGIQLALNGDNESVYIAEAGGQIRGDILWTNNTFEPVTNARIELKFEGNIFDRTSVDTEGGFFRSLDNTIIWDRTNTRGFDALPANGSGRVGFSFTTFGPGLGSASLRNPEMTLKINVYGTRSEGGSLPEELVSSVEKTVKLATTLSLSNRLVHYVGPFTNSGPMPPRADQETTYTVVWTLTNTSNSVRNTKVSASLPSYVSWKGFVLPSSEKVSYNPVTGGISWDAGETLPGAGYSEPPKELSFQVGFVPSLSQVETSPIIIGSAVAQGEDRFTDTRVTSQIKPALTIRLSTDSAYNEEEGKVVK